MIAQITWPSILGALLAMNLIIVAVRINTLIKRQKAGTLKNGWRDLKSLLAGAAIIAVNVAVIVGFYFYHKQ